MTRSELKPCFVLIIYLGYVHAFDIHSLYKQYKEAPGEGPRYLVLRRTFRPNATEYQIHIKRLKEVNALKQHNLMRSNNSLPVNETVYITNPVEAKLPQAFLSFDQFKQTLLAKVLKDRDDLKKQKLQAVIQNLWENRKKRKLTTRKVKTTNIIQLVKVHGKNTKHKKNPKLTTKYGKQHVEKAQDVDDKTSLAIKINNSDINVEKEPIISEGAPAVQESDNIADSKIIIVPLEPVAVEKAKDDTTETKKTTAKGQTRHNNRTSNQYKLGNTTANKTKVTLVSIAEKVVLKASDEATTAPFVPNDETSTPKDQNTANNESVVGSTASGELELTVDLKTTTESVSDYLGEVIDAKDGLNATESADTDEMEETTTPTIETATTAEDKSYEYVAEEETEESITFTTEKVTLGRPRVFMGR